MKANQDKRSGTIQMLVQNYLEQEHTIGSIYLYGELINDIDAFDKNIRSIKEIDEKFKSSEPYRNKPETIQAFINLISTDNIEYISSYEVKHESSDYIYKFDHILQLIRKTKYPDNTKLELILVPTDIPTISRRDSNVINVDSFEEYKNIILSFDKETQYNIFNMFVNNGLLKTRHVDDVLSEAIRLAKQNRINTYRENISFDDFETLLHNFSKITIRILTINELLSIPITNDFIRRYMDY